MSPGAPWASAHPEFVAHSQVDSPRQLVFLSLDPQVSPFTLGSPSIAIYSDPPVARRAFPPSKLPGIAIYSDPPPLYCIHSDPPVARWALPTSKLPGIAIYSAPPPLDPQVPLFTVIPQWPVGLSHPQSDQVSLFTVIPHPWIPKYRYLQ